MWRSWKQRSLTICFAQFLASRAINSRKRPACVNYSKSITLTLIQLITTTVAISTFLSQHPGQRKQTHTTVGIWPELQMAESEFSASHSWPRRLMCVWVTWLTSEIIVKWKKKPTEDEGNSKCSSVRGEYQGPGNLCRLLSDKNKLSESRRDERWMKSLLQCI